MSDYYGTGRSNYFIVKDLEAFKVWTESLDLEVIECDENGESHVGFIVTSDHGSYPTYRFNEIQAGLDGEGEEFEEEIDFFFELSTHLKDEEVAIFITSGALNSSLIGGQSIAVNSKNERTCVFLDDIYEKAKFLSQKTPSRI